MHTTKPLTPPATGGVFRSPPLARAHVDCRASRSQTGYINISLRSQTTGAPAYAHEGIGDRAAVERVRRQFGNRYARIASAYFRRKRWEAAKVPRRTFFHALKKVKDFLQADKHWAKTMSGGSRKRKSLH